MTEKEIKHFYNTKEWKEKRIRILERDCYECQDCRERIKNAVEKGKRLYGSEVTIRRANEVHHIKELREFSNLALEDDNLISLCTQCHNVRHGRNLHRFVKKKKRITEELW